MNVMTDWAKRGVWASVGLLVGVLSCSIFQSQRVDAVATSGGVEGGLIATGASQNNAVEFVWHLDDRGMLSCHLMGAQGRNVSAPPIDVKTAIKGKGGAKKGKYAMVTGRYTVQGQISDVLYLTESTSNAIAVFNFTNEGIRLVGTLGGASTAR
jgi:hypothetical protein